MSNLKPCGHPRDPREAPSEQHPNGHFVCCMCGRLRARANPPDVSRANGLAERMKIFGDVAEPDDHTVCDDCWQICLEKAKAAGMIS